MVGMILDRWCWVLVKGGDGCSLSVEIGGGKEGGC